MDKSYADTVRLLLAVAPEVFANPIFAMKGGTAINLFVQDMPRLSVDIDVVFCPWDVPRDDALLAIHDELVASIPPQEMMVTARWLFPSMNALERCMLANDMQAKAPAPAFDALLDVARQHLNQRDWAKLTRSINLPPVPGLMTV